MIDTKKSAPKPSSYAKEHAHDDGAEKRAGELQRAAPMWAHALSELARPADEALPQ